MMLSFGNIISLSSSLTSVPPCLPSLSQIFFLDEAHIPFVVAPDSLVDFSIQPPDIIDPFPSSPFNEQVEDEQVEDKAT